MYDLDGTDTDREWVEIKNTSSATIDLSGWKFNDGSNHVLNIPPANGGVGDIHLEAGDFAILASNASVFLSEHPNFSKTVIDTVMSLSNTADTIKIVSDTGDVVHEVSYQSDMGANGDGKTLQLYNGSYIAASPSPGVMYGGQSGGGGGGQEGTPPAVPPPKNEPPKEYPILASMDFSLKTISSQVPFIIKPTVTGKNREQIRYGKFVFTLGDGRVIEQQALQPFQVEYTHPGNYVLYFEYYPNGYTLDPVATERVQIIVKSSPLVIDTIDGTGSIYITNTEPQDIDISLYMLNAENKSFSFPKNTFIPGGKSIVVDAYIHKLPLSKQVTLYSPSYKKLFSYSGKAKVESESISSEKKSSQIGLIEGGNIILKKDRPVFLTGSPEVPPYVITNDTDILVNQKKLTENPLLSQVVSTEKSTGDNWYIAFGVLLIFGFLILFFILKTPSTVLASLPNQEEKIEDTYTIVEVK